MSQPNNTLDAIATWGDEPVKYRRLYESMMDAYALVDMNGRLREWNGAFEAMLGYSGEELQHLTYQDLTPERWHSIEAHILEQQLFAHDHTDVYEKEYRRKDGSIFPVEIRSFLVRDEAGKPAAIWAIVRDITDRKRIEAERSRLLKVLEASLNEIYQFEVETLRFNYVNAAAAANIGYSLDELSHMTPVDLKPEYNLESFRQLIAPLLARDSQKLVFETRHRRKDGSSYPVEVHLQLVETDDERVFLAVIHDITERRRVQSELEHQLLETRIRLEVKQTLAGRATEDQVLDALADSAGVYPDVFASVVTFEQHDGERCSVARRIRSYASGIVQTVPEGTRYPASVFKFVGQLSPDRALVIADVAVDPSVDEPTRRALLSLGAPSVAIVPMATGDELLGYLVLNARERGYFDESKLSLYRALANEGGAALHEVRLHEAVRASQRRLSLLVEQSPLGVIEWDTNLCVVSWNPAATRILGLDADQALGRHVNTIVGEHAAVVSVAGPCHATIDCRRPDGKNAAGEWFSTPLVGDAGEVVGIVSLVMDVSGRREAEAERAKLEAQLWHAQKLESVGRLAGGVAHDFNNMLTVILGYADLLISTAAPDDPNLSDLKQIQAAAKHAQDTTRQLLGFSRKQIISPQPLSLDSAIASMRKPLARLIGEDIELVVIHPAKTWAVHADPAQIEQILINLALNARDAMPRGGRLTLETASIVLDDDYCRSHPEAKPGRYVRLSVRDEGVGMDASTLEHVFEPFFTTKEVGKGTGLGLATVYGIVKQNGGLVDVQSELGHGSTFNVYLPRFEGEPESKPRPFGRDRARGSGTILLVEDDEMVRRLSTAMLTRLGYEVLSTNSGKEALELAKNHTGPIDLLLTDVVMVDRSGPQLRQEIAAIRTGIKVVFMSGYTSDVIVHHGVVDEGVHFLQKPFTQAELTDKIKTALTETFEPPVARESARP